MLFKNKHQLNEMRKHGRRATGEIISIKTVGEGKARRSRWALDEDLASSWVDCLMQLRVVPEQDSEPAFEATATARVNALEYLGGSVRVWYRPGDTSRVVVDHEAGLTGEMHWMADAERLAHRRDERTGLVWSPMGNDLVPFEVLAKPGKGRVAVKGHLDVYLAEHAAAAVESVRGLLASLTPDGDPGWLARHDVQIDGAFYIAPTLNELVLTGRRVGHCPVSADRYHSFYAPTLIPQYERLLQGRRLAGSAAGTGAGPKRLNVLIPMAGRGSRFARVGYAKPKPFIDVAGRTMIERVLDNLAIPGARYILMGRREHFEAEPELAAQLEARPDVVLCPVDLETEGTACTVLLARGLIDGDEPLLIANCDQIVDFDCASYIDDAVRRGLDGSILVFRDRDRDPKWSFARLGEDGLVREVREKVAISDLATVGIYHFRTGRIFIDAAVDMIARNDRTNGEFYTCPVYNYAIATGARIGVFEIAADAMHGLGTPEDLERYLARGTGVDGAGTP